MERVEPPEFVKHWKFRAPDTFFAPPGPLAEDLAPEIVLTALRDALSRREPAGHFHSAWRHVEYAINQNTTVFDANLRRTYIDDAARLLGGIVEKSHNPRSDIGENLLLKALTVGSFLPAFTKRALQLPITQQDCYDTYRSLGITLREQARYYRGKAMNFDEEIVTFAGAARTGQAELLIWPTSPREEGSKLQSNNHDGYFIRYDGKLPVQMKLDETGQEYEPEITTIYLLPILDHACMRAGLSQELAFGQSVEYAAKAIIAETTGRSVSKQQLRFLDYFSRSMAARCRYASLQQTA